MGSITRDMERLADEVRRGREERQRHASDLREGESQRQTEAARAADRRVREVAELRHQVRSQLTVERARLSEESAQLREKLQGFTQTLRDGVASFREEVRDDLAGARAAWSSLGGSAALATPAVVGVGPDPAVKVAPPAATDDLTGIPGIGPGIQERLNRAGISSFAVLAATPPDQLRSILGELNRLAHVEEWIAAAQGHLEGRGA